MTAQVSALSARSSISNPTTGWVSPFPMSNRPNKQFWKNGLPIFVRNNLWNLFQAAVVCHADLRLVHRNKIFTLHGSFHCSYQRFTCFGFRYVYANAGPRWTTESQSRTLAT